MLEKNQFDSNGLRHGYQERLWMTTGTLWYCGYCEHGIEVGIWEYYYSNGRLMYRNINNIGTSSYREEYEGIDNLVEIQFNI